FSPASEARTRSPSSSGPVTRCAWTPPSTTPGGLPIGTSAVGKSLPLHLRGATLNRWCPRRPKGASLGKIRSRSVLRRPRDVPAPGVCCPLSPRPADAPLRRPPCLLRRTLMKLFLALLLLFALSAGRLSAAPDGEIQPDRIAFGTVYTGA